VSLLLLAPAALANIQMEGGGGLRPPSPSIWTCKPAKRARTATF